MASQVKWFVLTAKFKKAVQLINELDSSKFNRLLQRIISKLHLKDEHIFTEEEEDKLQAAFDLNKDEITIMLDSLSFILEQAAYHNAKPASLQQQLQSIELLEEKISTFLSIWSENGPSVIAKLRKRSLAPKQLDSLNWRLNLQMSQSNRSKMKMPTAFFELGLKSSDQKDDENLRMEFTHDELYTFFQQMETIQSQLDAMTS
eukprot:gene9870-10880_t